MQAELARVAGLLERQYRKQVNFHELLPMCLVLREGARADARTLRSQAETFLKTELFKFCQLFNTDRLEEVWDKVDSLRLELDEDIGSLNQRSARCLRQPTALAFCWWRARTWQIFTGNRYRMWIGVWPRPRRMRCKYWRTKKWTWCCWICPLEPGWKGLGKQSSNSIMFRPQRVAWIKDRRSCGRFANGFRRFPFTCSLWRNRTQVGPSAGTVDDEVYLACIQAGGARGVITSRFIDGHGQELAETAQRICGGLLEITRRLHREKAAARLAQERKVLGFDTVPHVDGRTSNQHPVAKSASYSRHCSRRCW